MYASNKCAHQHREGNQGTTQAKSRVIQSYIHPIGLALIKNRDVNLHPQSVLNE